MDKKPKKYQIVVNGQCSTSALCSVEPHAYYVQAENNDIAQKYAIAMFHDAYPDAVNVSVSKEKQRNLPAIICMAIACFLSFIPWHSGGIIISLAPSMLSTMIAIALYSAVIIRLKGLQNSFNCASETILSCLTILFCASFISFLSGKETIQIFWFKLFISGKVLLTFAVLLSWIGMAAIAGFIWVALFIFAATRILLGDLAMGFWGNIYVLSAFLGIVFQLKQQSANFLDALGGDMVSLAARTKRRIISDTVVSADVLRGKINT
jgi:hypothetical protein